MYNVCALLNNRIRAPPLSQRGQLTRPCRGPRAGVDVLRHLQSCIKTRETCMTFITNILSVYPPSPTVTTLSFVWFDFRGPGWVVRAANADPPTHHVLSVARNIKPIRDIIRKEDHVRSKPGGYQLLYGTYRFCFVLSHSILHIGTCRRGIRHQELFTGARAEITACTANNVKKSRPKDL